MNKVIDVMALGLDFIASKEEGTKPVLMEEMNFITTAITVTKIEEAEHTEEDMMKKLEQAVREMKQVVDLNKGDRTKLYKAFKKGVGELDGYSIIYKQNIPGVHSEVPTV